MWKSKRDFCYTTDCGYDTILCFFRPFKFISASSVSIIQVTFFIDRSSSSDEWDRVGSTAIPRQFRQQISCQLFKCRRSSSEPSCTAAIPRNRLIIFRLNSSTSTPSITLKILQVVVATDRDQEEAKHGVARAWGQGSTILDTITERPRRVDKPVTYYTRCGNRVGTRWSGVAEREVRRGEGVKAMRGKQPALWPPFPSSGPLCSFLVQVCQWTAFQRHLDSFIVDLPLLRHFRSIRSSPKRGTTPARYLSSPCTWTIGINFPPTLRFPFFFSYFPYIYFIRFVLFFYSFHSTHCVFFHPFLPCRIPCNSQFPSFLRPSSTLNLFFYCTTRRAHCFVAIVYNYTANEDLSTDRSSFPYFSITDPHLLELFSISQAISRHFASFTRGNDSQCSFLTMKGSTASAIYNAYWNRAFIMLSLPLHLSRLYSLNFINLPTYRSRICTLHLT